MYSLFSPSRLRVSIKSVVSLLIHNHSSPERHITECRPKHAVNRRQPSAARKCSYIFLTTNLLQTSLNTGMSKILRNSVTLFTMVVNKYKPLHKSNIRQIIVATVVSPITSREHMAAVFRQSSTCLKNFLFVFFLISSKFEHL